MLNTSHRTSKSLLLKKNRLMHAGRIEKAGAIACRIRKDTAYTLPPSKLTANQEWTYDWVTDYQMFKILDSLKSTATGLDGLPAWFLWLGAPVFCKTLADLINLSISTSTVPLQWKRARICPVSKTSGPTQPSDFCTISVTRSLTYH